MNIYLALYAGKSEKVQAKDMYSAVLEARERLNVPKSKRGLLSVVLVNKAGTEVTHSTSSI